VIKLPVRPQNRIVALLASRRETCMRHRRRCVIEIRLVARHACRHRNVVVVIHVARSTWRRHVRPRKREPRLRVVKRRWLPRRRAVANFASLRIATRHVVRILRAFVIRQVARNASRHRDVVVIVHVTVHARRSRVRPRQRESCRRVIKLPVRP